ncbi:exonuclease domain-containing protein [Gallibacterium salpingitidis]|uniref:DNA polymerase III subunit epsilon n=1 Tax=Gallibacterium salpingitidis TaxID=505341 RepID=A0A1A7P377_9PAST|nr:exonuclease domain-containing protein [Gallibacterium salpingitidis]OBW96186.1 DNA polymerase III subunit epsilon [Gallibacterium salpingitidis]
MIWQFWHDPLKKLEKQRQKALDSADIPAMALPLFAQAIPNGDTPLSQLPLVALDFETSGLDITQDRILSVGTVEINQQVLSLATAQHYYLSTGEAIKPETAIINHIRPEVLTLGMSEQSCLQQLIPYLAGKIVIAHCATIEQNFLRKALTLSSSLPLPLIFLDTLCLARSLSEYWGKSNPDLRLAEIRQHKGLPAYLAHNAIADAIATGELFLALIAEIFPHQPVTLRQVMKQCATQR